MIDLIEKAVFRGEGHFSPDGALMVNTGVSTGRSTKERYVVRHPKVEDDIEWGEVNQPVSPEFGEKFFASLEKSMKDSFNMTGFVGCFRVTVNSKSPWHIAFAKNMFRSKGVEDTQESSA